MTRTSRPPSPSLSTSFSRQLALSLSRTLSISVARGALRRAREHRDPPATGRRIRR